MDGDNKHLRPVAQIFFETSNGTLGVVGFSKDETPVIFFTWVFRVFMVLGLRIMGQSNVLGTVVVAFYDKRVPS